MSLLLTRRWLGLLCLTVIAAGVMVMLGRWQWGRYEERSAINARIDASQSAAPVAYSPAVPEWTRVTLSGQYDGNLEILVRNRTVQGRVGFEVLTPLVLEDGSAVLVDRGWVPPHPNGPTADPEVPPAPGGLVTLTGRVRASESGARVQLINGSWQARRVGVGEIASKLPYRVAPTYVLADDEYTELVPIPSSRENDWLNLGYAIQWWIFAAGSFFALYWLARRELRQADVSQEQRLDEPASRAPAKASGQADVSQEQRLGETHAGELT
ncbi:SURF1 family protein [Allorhizocola rhizosphaerae]|uniref:SURF1 family cytochrome oxidase biogenesis protein n=1 Tax=Allorhizocola rhizosphaerae TaxID=1872709 RepID=UPI001FE74506|nr:SURF1 family protein [Allorhizocola rhizosphaerae]